MLSHDVLRTVVDTIEENDYFSIIMDKAADISGKEQISICFLSCVKGGFCSKRGLCWPL